MAWSRHTAAVSGARFAGAGTGRVPSALSTERLELECNSWHDWRTADLPLQVRDAVMARAMLIRLTARTGERLPMAVANRASAAIMNTSRAATLTKTGAEQPRARSPTGDGQRSVEHGSVGTPSTRIPGSRRGDQSNLVAAFVGGVGQGLYDIGEGTVARVRAALATNPATATRYGVRAETARAAAWHRSFEGVVSCPGASHAHTRI